MKARPFIATVAATAIAAGAVVALRHEEPSHSPGYVRVASGGRAVYVPVAGKPLCVRAPLDGGADCLRKMDDGNSRFFGTGNVFNASEASGSNCEPVAAGCSAAGGIVFGDDPSVDL